MSNIRSLVMMMFIFWSHGIPLVIALRSSLWDSENTVCNLCLFCALVYALILMIVEGLVGTILPVYMFCLSTTNRLTLSVSVSCDVAPTSVSSAEKRCRAVIVLFAQLIVRKMIQMIFASTSHVTPVVDLVQ